MLGGGSGRIILFLALRVRKHFNWLFHECVAAGLACCNVRVRVFVFVCMLLCVCVCVHAIMFVCVYACACCSAQGSGTCEAWLYLPPPSEDYGGLDPSDPAVIRSVCLSVRVVRVLRF